MTIDDVSDYLGESVPAEDEDRVQTYIDIVSEFIETYTGRAFSLQEDVEHVARANSWGVIEFPELTSVSNVELLDGYTGDWYTTNGYGYSFDGINSIYGLEPYSTYRVTVTYGSDTVPDVIKHIATLLVVAGTGYDVGAVGGLKKVKTGNVEDTYGVSESGAVTLSDMMLTVLSDYDVGMSRP